MQLVHGGRGSSDTVAVVPARSVLYHRGGRKGDEVHAWAGAAAASEAGCGAGAAVRNGAARIRGTVQ
eukprot:scaffold184766_cov17-Tisochrysis_lutea.AAC.1